MASVILHPHAPGARLADQGWTWVAVTALVVDHDRTVVSVALHADHDYARRLAEAWRLPYDLIVVEHDVVPTPAAIDELDACPEPACAATYPVYDAGGNVEGWCTTGLGCTKLTLRARRAVAATPPVPDVAWSEVAGEVSRRVGPYHVHDLRLTHHHGRR